MGGFLRSLFNIVMPGLQIRAMPVLWSANVVNFGCAMRARAAGTPSKYQGVSFLVELICCLTYFSLLQLLPGVGQQCTFSVIAFGVFLGPHLYWANI